LYFYGYPNAKDGRVYRSRRHSGQRASG